MIHLIPLLHCARRDGLTALFFLLLMGLTFLV
jgi:hypothetical protein